MRDDQFLAVPAQKELVAKLSDRTPANPFASCSYFESINETGSPVWVLGLTDHTGGILCGCLAHFESGRLHRTLEIPSLPSVGEDSLFWAGLREFCKDRRVTKLELGTFGSSPGVEIPSLGVQCSRRSRCEFILHLAGYAATQLSSNHKRNVQKAQKAGMTVKWGRSVEAAQTHHALMNQSFERRRLRGEHVGSIGPREQHLAFLKCGAGELCQAILDGSVLSSILVLRAPQGAYYQSAGTSPEGMSKGAAQFLIHSVASQLSDIGLEVFNLGGAEEESGLARFKEGFGAWKVHLPAASCYVGSSWRRWLGELLTLIRHPGELQRAITQRSSRMIVYAALVDEFHPPESQVGMVFCKLTAEELSTLSVEDPSFNTRQIERLHRFGASYAYAVFVEGRIAHVSWLLPPAAIHKDVPRVLRARSDEAEITCSETLPEFRGRGAYRFAIHNLLDVARKQGVRRVFMKTAADNKPSQSGIEKAGLKRIGSATIVVLPVTQRHLCWLTLN
jgi:ribosomal protein S18 acetylase RimI-like enzyme